jgi:hypothetical protein
MTEDRSAEPGRVRLIGGPFDGEWVDDLGPAHKWLVRRERMATLSAAVTRPIPAIPLPPEHYYRRHEYSDGYVEYLHHHEVPR